MRLVATSVRGWMGLSQTEADKQALIDCQQQHIKRSAQSPGYGTGVPIFAHPFRHASDAANIAITSFAPVVSLLGTPALTS